MSLPVYDLILQEVHRWDEEHYPNMVVTLEGIFYSPEPESGIDDVFHEWTRQAPEEVIPIVRAWMGFPAYSSVDVSCLLADPVVIDWDPCPIFYAALIVQNRIPAPTSLAEIGTNPSPLIADYMIRSIEYVLHCKENADIGYPEQLYGLLAELAALKVVGDDPILRRELDRLEARFASFRA